MPKTKYEITKAYRQRNPMRYAFLNLRSNAKRRGVPFELTFEDFSTFAVEVDYLYWKGISKKAYHIDRIDPNKGYLKDNIQLMTNEANIKKHHGVVSQFFCPYENKMKYNIEISIKKDDPIQDSPF